MAVILSVAFVAFSAIAAAGWTRGADLWVLGIMQEHPVRAFDDIGLFLSIAGSVPVSTLAMLAVALTLRSRGRRQASGRLILAFLATALVEVAMKTLLPQSPIEASAVRVAAPSLLMDFETPFPYPSGHVIRSVLALGALASVYRRTIPKGLILMLIALMAISRIYVGAHWTSDVVGGLLLGTAALAWVFAGREVKEEGWR